MGSEKHNIKNKHHMTPTNKSKHIYTAIAAPGAGKTEALLTKLTDLSLAEDRVILALPTLALIDEVSRRAQSKGITCCVIDHRAGEGVAMKLENVLSDRMSTFIICTQESLRSIKPTYLCEWTLVLDETPKVVDYPDYTPKPVELERITQYTEERDGQLFIRKGCEDTVREQVATHRRDIKGTDCSTLGQSAAHVFRLLLSKVVVFIGKPLPDGRRHIHAVEEFSKWWSIFTSAKEVHALTASIANSEFEIFAKVHGFEFLDSKFTPRPRSIDSSLVTIFPVVPKGQIFSKRMMLGLHNEEPLLNTVLRRIKELASSPPLLFANEWANYKYTCGVIYAAKDCRGLNAYANITEVAVLFGGNASPAENKSLDYLESKYKRDFKDAFITTRLLEPSLQAVTRTSVRCHGNTRPINFYVQDSRVVDFLTTTYFPEARIDWSLSTAIPISRDGRKLDDSKEKEILHLLSLNHKIATISKTTGASRKTISKIKATFLAT